MDLKIESVNFEILDFENFYFSSESTNSETESFCLNLNEFDFGI